MLKPPVDFEIYKEVAEAVSADFAFSYLGKASQKGSVITPHTVTGWERLVASHPAMKVIQRHKCIVQKPDLWHPGRDDAPQYPVAA